MTAALFPVIEIGSLAKLPGREMKLQGKEPTSKDIENLQRILALVQSPELERIASDFLAASSRADIVHYNSLFNIVLLQTLGLDYIFDGEAHRREMYEHVLRSVGGMKELGMQVSFVNKQGLPNTFVPYIFENRLSLTGDPYLQEADNIISAASAPVKIPVTGAYTLATWSDPGSLASQHIANGLPQSKATNLALSELVEYFAKEIINPQLKGLASKKGVARIQIDEPNASAFPDQEDLFYRATELSLDGVAHPSVGLHVCFSRDYGSIANVVRHANFQFITLELANRDTPDHQSYTSAIRAFEAAGFKGSYAVGVFDVHTNRIPSPKTIANRLRHVADLVCPERVESAPDCGLRSRHLDVAIRQLYAFVKGTELARQHYS